MPELLTVNEAADRLRVSQQTVRQLIHRGHLSGIRIGDRVLRIPVAELDRILATGPKEETHADVDA